MGNYATLKAAIQDVIKTNGNNEITGALLQQSLVSIINSLGAGYQYMGVAEPSTNPGTPDQRVLYLAIEPGQYSNFGYSVSLGELAIFTYSNGWNKAQIYFPVSVINGNDSKNLILSVVENVVRLAISDSKITLDSIAYENLTYRQIFETNNLLGISPGFETGSYSPLTVSAGSPTITGLVKDSGNYSLMASGSGSQQVRTPSAINVPAFTACRVNVTEWTAGDCGISYGSDQQAAQRGVSDGWVTKVGEKTTTGSNVRAFVGSFSSANLTGYVDTPVVVAKSIFSTAPTISVWESLYSIYVRLKKGETIPQESQILYLATKDNPEDKFIKNLSTKTIGIEFDDDNVIVNVGSELVNLDSLAYETFSYRDIFETMNLLGITPGFENGSYSPLIVNAGSPTVQSSIKDSGNYSLMASGSSSQQLKTESSYNKKLFVACRVNVTQYSAGYCGIQYRSINVAAIDRLTNGWETKGGKITPVNTTNYPVYVGSFSSANLTGYVDTPVAIAMDNFSQEPSDNTLLELYEIYCSLKRGEHPSGVKRIYLQEKTTQVTPDSSVAIAKFVEKMNERAQQIGALNSHFSDPSGLTYAGSQVSANDVLQILIHAAGIEKIAEKWNKKTYTMQIFGSNARTENIISSVQNTTYYDDSANPILGGKTGTLTPQSTWNLMFCTVVNEIPVAISIIGSTSDANRWRDAQKIVDYLGQILNGQTATLDITAAHAAACKLPPVPIMYDNFPFLLLVSKSPSDATSYPASLTKIMSLITAYDYIVDENETVEIQSSDLIGGSGNNLNVGDIVPIKELVYDMLLPSSNSAATALARHIGVKILRNEQQ